MKRTVSILIIILTLASAMRITIDRHFCGGKVADVKLELSFTKASCGMEEDNKKPPDYDAFSVNCCYNKLSTYNVDNYLISNALAVNKQVSFIRVVFETPVNNFIGSKTTAVAVSDTGPPGVYPLRPDGQSILCNFRI
jgi:hypothetical protein